MARSSLSKPWVQLWHCAAKTKGVRTQFFRVRSALAVFWDNSSVLKGLTTAPSQSCGHWDNDDNDFLEFVGKTAAITAGVCIDSAVIGSVVNATPGTCHQSMSSGEITMNCNAAWFHPVMNNGQQHCTVIAPPR